MDKIKNYAIAVLTGLLALALFTQPAQSAGTSIQAKQMQYLRCLQSQDIDPNFTDNEAVTMKYAIKNCAAFRP
jgi:hypothetical protein